MIDVMENIKKLSAALDAETASLHPSGKLLLLGSQDSVFLKAINGQQAYGTTWPFGKYGSPLHGRGISRHFEKAL